MQIIKIIFLNTIILSSYISLLVVSEEECHNQSDNDDAQIIRNGKIETIEDVAFKKIDVLNNGRYFTRVANINGGESINLRYVKSFLSKEEVSKLISICDKRNGWQISPQNVDGTAKINKKKRTSSSCPIIWPLVYLPRIEALKSSGRLTQDVEEEINFAWMLTQRIASFLNVNEAHVEPLQLIRYNPGQFYRQHHDHGLYYGVNTSEQRPITFLVFLSTMPSENSTRGGQTKFNNLNIEIIPKLGDGIIWSNVDENNNLLLDAVHEAVPPPSTNNEEDVIKKYAMNIWITDIPVMENIDSSVYRTY